MRPILAAVAALLLLAPAVADARPSPQGKPSRSGGAAAARGAGAGAGAAAGQREGAERSARLAEVQGKLPEPSAAQQQNLASLKEDLGVLAGGAQAAEGEIRGLAHDLQGMAVQPPDPALVQQLATDLQSAVADSSLSPKEVAQLSESVMAVMNSAGLSQGELEVLKDDVEAVLTASGVDQGDVQAVVADLQAIYDEMQSNAPAASGGARKARPSRGR